MVRKVTRVIQVLCGRLGLLLSAGVRVEEKAFFSPLPFDVLKLFGVYVLELDSGRGARERSAKFLKKNKEMEKSSQ